jgi:hypothetical protein
VKKVITAIVIIFLLLLFFFLPVFIKVRIECVSQFGECPAEIKSALEKFEQKNFFSAKSQIIKFVKSDYMVSDYFVQFKLPNIAYLNILIKKPSYAVKSDLSAEYALVDKDGTVLAFSEETTLPVIFVGSKLPGVGEKLDVRSIFALGLIDGVYRMYQVYSGKITNEALLIELPGQIGVIFPLEGDSDLLLGSLRLIYSKLQTDMNPSGYTQIDLRFNNPVIR